MAWHGHILEAIWDVLPISGEDTGFCVGLKYVRYIVAGLNTCFFCIEASGAQK